MESKKVKSKLAGINSILPGVITKLGLDRRMQEQAFFSLWPNLIDPIYVSRSRPLYIDNQGILVVAVDNGSTAQEFSFLKAKLLSKLQTISVSFGLTLTGIRFDLKRFSQSIKEEQFPDMPTKEFTAAPTNDQLAALLLDEGEINEIAELKDKLNQSLKSDMGSTASQMADRISFLVEKRLRLKKWYSST